MYTLYEKDEVERYLSFNIAFNMQIPDQVECLVVFACWK